MLEQHQRILAALAQRGDLQRRDVQPVVEVGAEAPLVGGLAQVLLGRGDNPDIQRNQLVGTHALHDAFLQQAQQLDLHVQAHALDLVEEQGAAVGMLELADAALGGAGEGAGLVAEQLAFHHRLGQRAGVDGHERAVAARGKVVQRARHHFLAGAGFAEDQHVGGGGRQGSDLLAQALHDRRAAEQPHVQLLAVGQRQAQAAVVQHQAAQVQGAAHAVEQMLAGEGFFQEVVGAGTHGLHGQRHIAVAGDQQHRQLRVALLDLRQQLQAIQAGHADVADHHAGPVAIQARGDTLCAVQGQHPEAGQVQGLAEGQAQVRVVVDQQYLDRVVDGGFRTHADRSSGG